MPNKTIKRRTRSTASTSAASPAASNGKRPSPRGLAPWASRQANRQAEESARRNASPPLPGSARATLREPEHAEEIKARIQRLHTAVSTIRKLRKQLPSRFYEIGGALRDIQDAQLYDAKGYKSFEAFVERELDLGKGTALQLARVPDVFQPDAAQSFGLEAVLSALGALDAAGPSAPVRSAHPSKPPRPRH